MLSYYRWAFVMVLDVEELLIVLILMTYWLYKTLGMTLLYPLLLTPKYSTIFLEIWIYFEIVECLTLFVLFLVSLVYSLEYNGCWFFLLVTLFFFEVHPKTLNNQRLIYLLFYLNVILFQMLSSLILEADVQVYQT